VITGENREELGALVLPFLPELRELLPAEDKGIPDEQVYAHPAVRKALADKLAAHQRQANASSNRIMRIMIMVEPPRFDKGEVTDKGSLNQRAVLTQREALVEELYSTGGNVILAS